MRYALDPARSVYQQIPEDAFTCPMAAATGSTVYRFFDGGTRLLYVGITSRPRDRWYQHSRTAEWWHLARVVDVTEVRMTSYQARLEESRAINEDSPIFNIAQATVLSEASLSNHGVLSESSVRTPTWKGREGKGRENRSPRIPKLRSASGGNAMTNIHPPLIGGCWECGRSWAAPGWVWIPDDMWEQIAPIPQNGTHGSGHLCIHCITAALIRIGAEDVEIAIWAAPYFTRGFDL